MRHCPWVRINVLPIDLSSFRVCVNFRAAAKCFGTQWDFQATHRPGIVLGAKEIDMKILTTIFAVIAVGILGAVGFIYSGIYDVSALQPDNAVVAWVVSTTSDRSVNARLSNITVPTGLDKLENIQSGGHLFADNCAVCHGGPGLKSTNIAKGLNPAPPDLFRATRVPASDENFRFIKYGVKMTAMPGFGPTLSDDQIWQLVAFLGKAPGITPAGYTAQTGLSASAQVGTKSEGG